MNIFKQFATIQIGQYRNPNCKAKNTPKKNKEMKDSVIYECVSQGFKITITEDGVASYNVWQSKFGRYSKQRLLKSFDNSVEAINFGRSIFNGQTKIN